MHLERRRRRSWTAAAAAVGVHLRHPSNPARLAVIAALLFCFVIVLTPPQLQFKPSGIAASLTAASGSGSAAPALLDRARTRAALQHPAHEAPAAAAQPAQWAPGTEA